MTLSSAAALGGTDADDGDNDAATWTYMGEPSYMGGDAAATAALFPLLPLPTHMHAILIV